MEKFDRHLFPPPRMMPHGEFRPIIEPPLRDMAPFPGSEMIDEWETFMSGPVENLLTEELVRRAQAVALADERVKRWLNKKRYIPVGASLLEKRDEPRESSLLFVFYDYTDNLTIEVSLDRTAQEVTGVREAHYQPAPTEQEIEQAVSLARRDSRLTERLTDDLEGTAILVSPVDPDDPNYSHRQFDVRFGCPTERLPRYMALVDLSTETVVRVGPGCAGELGDRGGTR